MSRNELDKNSNFRGFEYHLRQEHNVYSYVFYISYLRQKDPTEYSGIESYVSEKLKEGDISWFPLDFDKCQELKASDNMEILQTNEEDPKDPLLIHTDSADEHEHSR